MSRTWLKRSPVLRPWAALGRCLLHGSLGLALGLLLSCAPHPRAGAQAIAALPRGSVVVPGALPREVVSYLHQGDPALPRVLYIHGTPGEAQAWADYLVEPVARLEAIAVDRLGFGQSQPPAVVTSFHDQARSLAPLLVERQGRWPIVVGHSLGGPIAAQLAAEYPDRVGALVILAGSLDPGQEHWHWYNELADSPWVGWLVPTAMARANAEVRDARWQTTLLEPWLARITCPVVIVHGEDDDLVPVANVAYTQAHLTHAASVRVILIPKQGHLLPWQQEPLIRQVIADLRDEMQASGQGARHP